MKCPVCKSLVYKKIQLNDMPNGNICCKSITAAKKEPIYSFALFFCNNCQHIWHDCAVEEPQTNQYSSTNNTGIIKHYQGFVVDTIKRFDLSNNSLVMEIGSGDGRLLKQFLDFGVPVLGCEPVKSLCKKARDINITTINKKFEQNITQKRIDIICINDLLANLKDLDTIFKGVETILKDNGIFIINTFYGLDVIKNTYIDMIYHEHLHYFSLHSLAKLCSNFNLEIFHAKKNRQKGSSICIYICKNKTRVQSKYLKSLFYTEKTIFRNSDLFAEFKAQIIFLQHEVLKEIGKIQKPICAYGASISTISMLEHLNLPKHIDYLIDDDASKINKFSPYRATPIKSKDLLLKCNIKYVFILAWRFMDAIKKNNKEFLKNGGIMYNINLKNKQIQKVSL